MEKNSLYITLLAVMLFLVLFFIQSERISVQGEKIASLEDIVFNHSLYPRIEKEVTK